MNHLSEAGLYERWQDRWEDFLTRVGEAADGDAVSDILRDKVMIGNAERKIAGGHEGREILELLQNARDAILQGDAESGHVHVGVYDEGVLVANTGSRFDLFDTDVEDAVTMIGETGKGEDDDQSIGHKGVGLKSILATGDSFEIYTRPDPDLDDILGVRLSRAYLLAALLGRLGHEVNTNRLSGELDDDELTELLRANIRDDKIPLSDDLHDKLSKLPLFNFPVPLDMDNQRGDPVQQRVEELLTKGSSNEEELGSERFRTAVFIRYEDDDWRDLLNQWNISLPDEDERNVETRPERIWNYLSVSSGKEGLRPETLVQLGGISTLQLERSSRHSPDDGSHEQWNIIRSSESGEDSTPLTHEHVDVNIEANGNASEIHSFDHFYFRENRDHHTALLINKASDDGKPPVDEYPLYLFYPIASTNHASLPFCLHGRFRVETNRKDLSNNNLRHNRSVLEEGLDLIELVAQKAATTTDDEDYSQFLPWSLVPPVPNDEVSDPSNQDELITWFQQQLIDRLSHTECVPTREGAARPTNTTLHWEPSVLSAYPALIEVLAAQNRSLETTDARPFPARAATESLLDVPEGWLERVRRLLPAEPDAVVSNAVLDDWVTHLRMSNRRRNNDPPAITVPTDPARRVLNGTVRLVVAATGADESIDSTLETYADPLDGVYLLPCQIKGVDSDEELALATIERRRSPEGGRAQVRRTRSVIWDIKSASQEVRGPPTPPQASNFTVYFLDEAVQGDPEVHQVLSLVGRLWGLRSYEGIPSFVRSLLDTYAEGTETIIEPTDFAFLTAIIDRIGSESVDLQPREGDFFPLEYLQTAVKQSEGDQRGNLRRRVQLRERSLRLPNDDPSQISGTVLGDDWQRVREQARADEDEDSTADWTKLSDESYPADTWPTPDAPTWEPLDQSIKRDVGGADFAATLGLLGAGTLPGVEIVWIYGSTHPPMRTYPSWDPAKWSEDDFPESIPEQIKRLQKILKDTVGYRTAIVGPGNHPQVSAYHSPKCNVKTDGSLSQVNLASWVWLEDPNALESHGETTRELLRRHGDAFVDSILQTGWTCNNGHKRRTWTDTVPTLLNWQLRSLDIWEPLITVDDALSDQWAGKGERLQHAVRLESARGAQGARMFPHVVDDVDFPSNVLDALGVRPLDELSPAAAADRLQTLQSVLVEDELPDEGTARLYVPGDRINDWNQAYTQLLQPILKRLPEDGAASADVDWGSLTHLPLRDGDRWVTAPIDWITDNADRIRYFRDLSPKPWETYAVNEAGHLVLSRTSSGPFVRLVDSLGIQRVDASKLVFEPENLTFVTDEHTTTIKEFQDDIEERRSVLIASTERTDEDEVTETATTLSAAVDDLAIAKAFPESADAQLSDPSSGLYTTETGHEALIINADASRGDGLSLDDLAMGVALLFERPTKVATFREALQTDLAVTELESRWEKRTFPIDTVNRILGSNAIQQLEIRIAAVADLVDIVGGDPHSISEEALAVLESVEQGDLDAVTEWIATGNRPDVDNNESPVADPVVAELVTAVRSSVPEELTFILEGLFQNAPVDWLRKLENHPLNAETQLAVIEWLDDHRRALDRDPFDKQARAKYSRFETVCNLWKQTDRTELTEVDAWTERLREFHSSEEILWTAKIESTYASAVDCPPQVAFVTRAGRIESLVDALCDDISSEFTDAPRRWRNIVEQYVAEGTLPEPESTAGASDHQERAFNDISINLRSGDDELMSFDADNIELGPTSANLTVSTGSGGSGGGSSQFRGRGQQAEAYVMAGVLDRVADLFENHPEGDLFQFRSKYKRLYEDQQGANYQWHVDNVWQQDLLNLLSASSDLQEDSFTSWQNRVKDGRSLMDLQAIRLINVTMERGPGFDVIDPLGPLSPQSDSHSQGFNFVPVEVKAVSGSTPPFNFRLTTNEYRRAKAFVRDAGVPYVIRLVSVPETGVANWPTQTEVVAEKVIESVEELDRGFDTTRFEEVVKGGYMNMSVE